MTSPEEKARITADFCEMVRLLRQIDPPERHRWEVDPLALHWNRGDAIASVAHGAPITLRLHPRNDDSPAQLRVELRLFWRIASGPEAEGAPLRAVLRAEHGRQIGHQATSLLDAHVAARRLAAAARRRRRCHDLHARRAPPRSCPRALPRLRGTSVQPRLTMDDRFDPSDAATWIARGRSPEHAEALAQAWRDFPDLPPTAAPEDRMARTRARVGAMRPVNDAIQLASEAERQRRNFLHIEGKAATGSIDDSDLAILRGRDAYGYDWDAAVCYSRGWYAAHAGWTYGGPDISNRLPAHRAAYDRGFFDGGGDTHDLFDAARRSNVAAEWTGNQPRPLAPALAARPLPSSWPKPSDEPRPARWTRRLLILADDPALGNAPTASLVDQIRARPEAEGLNIIVLSAAAGFCATAAPDAPPLTTGRCEALARDPRQTARLRALVADMTIDDILIAAPDDAMAVVDAHAAALPLCRTMERTRNTILQQRAHLRTWLDRAATGDGNVGAGHIRWSKLAKGLSGKLGEFTVRYAGKGQDSPGHIIVVETSGTPAVGFVTADGRPLDPRITFGNKSRMRQEMATALRAFGGATRLAPTLFATAA